MTFGSLFSGIGGIDLGLERAGMVCKWQVEINIFCQMILTKHWPGVPKHADIKEVGGYNLEKVDLIAGGFPCQPYSKAGKRRGKDDDRYLWPEMLRVIRELKPTWVFCENVTGLLSINEGWVIEEVLSDLESESYETMPPFIIPACGVDADHKRDRLWILAYSHNGEHIKSVRRGNQAPDKIQKINKKEHSSTGRSSRTSTVRKASNGYTDEESCRSWITEPELGRVVDGIPNQMDRLKSLGNAVVPQVVELIGRAIIDNNR